MKSCECEVVGRKSCKTVQHDQATNHHSLLLCYSPAYMMPWLNGLSVPCLATMGASLPIRRTIAKIFGGAAPNQGLGLLSISLDPQYVSPGSFASNPLKWQLQYFCGSMVGAIFLLAFYYTNAWNAQVSHVKVVSMAVMSSTLLTLSLFPAFSPSRG